MFTVITDVSRNFRVDGNKCFAFPRILFTKENYIIFLNTPVLGYAGFRHTYCMHFFFLNKPYLFKTEFKSRICAKLSISYGRIN